MAIRWRGKVLQVDVVVNGHRKQVNAGTDEAKAKQVELDLIAEMSKLPSVKGGSVLLGDVLEAVWVKDWQGAKAEHQTKKLIKLIKDYWNPERSLETITTLDVDKWVASLKALGNANGTINRKVTILSKVFRYAVSRKLISQMPLIERQKEYGGRDRFLAPKEEAEILNWMSKGNRQDCWDACVVFIDTGLREGELLAIHETDVITPLKAGKRSRLAVPIRKGDTPGGIPLSERALAVLQRRIAAIKPEHKGRVFAFRPSFMSHTWERMRIAMGLADDAGFVPYCMRHTYASRLAQRGFDLKRIGILMGHGSVKVTERYAHLIVGANDDMAADAEDDEDDDREVAPNVTAPVTWKLRLLPRVLPAEEESGA